MKQKSVRSISFPTPRRYLSLIGQWLRRKPFAMIRWLISQIVLFLKALPLLACWLVLGIVLFWLAKKSPLGQELGIEPNIALFATLLTALVGFGVQQWNHLVDDEKTRRAQREAARGEIDSLLQVLSDNLSEGARLYRQYARKIDSVWQDAEVKDYFAKKWEENAPRELRSIVSLRERLEHGGGSPYDRYDPVVANDLEWAYENLDEDWQQSIAGMVTNNWGIGSDLLRNKVEDPLWRAVVPSRAVVSPWTSLEQSASDSDSSDIAKGVRFLGLEENPFGALAAESDYLLFRHPVLSDKLQRLKVAQPTLVVGEQGSGKSAYALLLIREALLSRVTFPIYCVGLPALPARTAQLDGLVNALAQTLLRFIAARPQFFNKQSIAGRSAMVDLWGRYIGAHQILTLRLQQAGLAPIGVGEEVLKEVTRLIPEVGLPDSSDVTHLLALLTNARPREFTSTFMVLDLPNQVLDHCASVIAQLKALLELTQPLAHCNVFLKVFLPKALLPALKDMSSLDQVTLDWSVSDLRDLILMRMANVHESSLSALCDPKEGNLDPDERLAKAAQGSPRRLIQLGNELLARVGKQQRQLARQDLDEILRPLS